MVIFLVNNLFQPAGLPSITGGAGGGSVVLISQYRVTVFACANAPGIYHIANEDAAVADLSCMSCLDYHLYGWLNELIATDDGDSHALNYIRRILDTTVYALLSALADAVYVVVLEPVDVR